MTLRILFGSSMVLVILGMGIDQSSAGWVIDKVVSTAAGDRQQEEMIQSNHMKTITLGQNGKPKEAFILDLTTDTITQVNYEKRTYMRATVQEYTAMLRNLQQMMKSQMDDTMKAMREKMKDLPPEQRKKMEQMMGAGMSHGDTEHQPCKDPNVVVQKSTQQASIAGHQATRYDIVADGKMETELWIASSVSAWKELDAKKLEQFFEQVTDEVGTMGGGCLADGRKPVSLSGSRTAWKYARDGYPLRVIPKSSSGGKIEVTKAESKTIPLEEFQMPANFTQRTLQDMMKR